MVDCTTTQIGSGVSDLNALPTAPCSPLHPDGQRRRPTVSDFTDYEARTEPLQCTACGEEILEEELACQFCVADLHTQCIDGHFDKEHEVALERVGYYD
jgi:hypothetical protein